VYSVNEGEKRNEPTEENFEKTQEIIKEFYGSSEALIQQTTEAKNHCFRTVMGYSYDDAEYNFLELATDEIEEGIATTKKFIDAKEDYIFDVESMK